MRTGVCAAALLALPSLALADPASSDFSQQMFDQQSDQQLGPWAHTKVNVPQISGSGMNGSSSVDLSAISAGQGGTSSGNGAAMQAVGSALSVPLAVVGGTGGASPLGSGAGAGGLSPGAIGAGATGSALGALNIGLGGLSH